MLTHQFLLTIKAVSRINGKNCSGKMKSKMDAVRTGFPTIFVQQAVTKTVMRNPVDPSIQYVAMYPITVLVKIAGKIAPPFQPVAKQIATKTGFKSAMINKKGIE